MKHSTILASLVLLGAYTADAQSINFLFAEYNHSIFQEKAHTEANPTIPMGDKQDWNWPSYAFFAGIDSEDQVDNISNATITGPAFPSGQALLYDIEDNGYEVELPFADEISLANAITAGTYTITGTGNVIGAINENISIPSYTKLNDLLVTNYTELQSFDPSGEVTINWQIFSQGVGTVGDLPAGFVEIEVSYWDDNLQQSIRVFSTSDLPVEELNAFDAMPYDRTSITIPQGAGWNSPWGVYTVEIFFLKIDNAATPSDTVNLADTMIASVTSMDLILEIREQSQGGGPNPWDIYSPMGGDWYDTGSWLGMVYTTHRPWVFSSDLGAYIMVPDEGITPEGGWAFVPMP